MESKYIRVEVREKYGIIDAIIIFPKSLSHLTIAAKFEKVISAGFVDLNNMTCYSDSIGLKLSSKPEDSILLKSQIGI